MSERKRIVIVGGGITGLSAAYRLQCAARAQNLPLDITLLESEPHLGGKIQTWRADGFVVEGGPDSFLASKPQATALCEALGIADRLITTNNTQKRTYIYSRGRLHDLPEGLSGLVPSRLAPLLRSSLILPFGKARLLMDFVLPARAPNGDESLAHFVSRRLGREAFERLIEPLMGGIYAGDASQLSLTATFPQLRQLELKQGSLLRGVMQNAPSPTQRGFLSLRGGMGDLVDALQQQLTVAVRCGVSVQSIGSTANGYALETNRGTLSADALIITTPAYVSAPLLQSIDRALADAHAAIPHVSTATISLAYRRADLTRPLHGFGFVVPTIERRVLLACTWASNKFAGRAPDDVLLLRCFIGRAGQETLLDRDDDALVQLARDELHSILQIDAPPLFSKVYRWMRGMPQYHLGHVERVAQIEQRLTQHPGLFVAGAAYRGVGIPDCIRSAEGAAAQAITFLTNDELRTTNGCSLFVLISL